MLHHTRLKYVWKFIVRNLLSTKNIPDLRVKS